MDEAELESFRLWGGLLLLAKQHPGGSASWAVNEIERQRAEIERLEELLWQEAGNRVEIERLRATVPQRGPTVLSSAGSSQGRRK